MGAAMNLVYIGILLYCCIELKAAQAFSTFGLGLFIAAWICGIAWCLLWKYRNREHGVDVRITYREPPPE